MIKRARWLLLRSHDNLKPEQTVQLEDLLAANAPLATTYLLKTELKELWFAPSLREARQRWRQWYRLALNSALVPVIRFARRLRRYLRGDVRAMNLKKGPMSFRHQPFSLLLIMVRLAGIEPTTPWFVAKYSIQLSYSREDRNYSRLLLVLGSPAAAVMKTYCP